MVAYRRGRRGSGRPPRPKWMSSAALFYTTRGTDEVHDTAHSFPRPVRDSRALVGPQ